MGGKGHQVGPQFPNVRTELPGSLCCVGVQDDAVFPGDSCDFGNGLDRTRLVVGVHDGDQDRIRTDPCFNLAGIYHADIIHRKVRYFESLAF